MNKVFTQTFTVWGTFEASLNVKSNKTNRNKGIEIQKFALTAADGSIRVETMSSWFDM